MLLDFAQQFSHWLVMWVVHHPLAVIIPFGWCWAIGALLKLGKVTLAPLVGFLATLFAIGWLWKRRRDIGRGVLVTIVSLVVAAWGLALWASPEKLKWVLLVAVFAALVFFLVPGDVLWAGQPGGWVWEKVGNESLGDALRTWVESHQLHAQLVAELGADAGVKRPRKVGGEWRVESSTVGDPGRIDPHKVGARGNKVTNVRQVGVVPGDHLGSATITLSPDPPPPTLTPWERFAQLGPLPWPGPSTSKLDDPMRVLFDPWGQPLPFPVPGLTGNNMLLTGPTGAGKSGALHVIMADLAFRHGLAIIYLDPHAVEGALWEERCSYVAQGEAACVKAIAQIPHLMEARGRRMKGRSWSVKDDGPRILFVYEEYASIPQKAKAGATRGLAEGRKFGIGSIICLQRAERDFIQLAQRDNCRVRVACGAESAEASRMTLGHGEGIPLATQIPEGLKGGAIVRVEQVYRPGRFYLLTPPGGVPADVDPMEVAAPQIARATAGLRIPMEQL